MTDIKTFSTADYNIECVMVSSDPWFRGRDVAASLGYKDRDQAIRDHVDESGCTRPKLEENDLYK